MGLVGEPSSNLFGTQSEWEEQMKHLDANFNVLENNGASDLEETLDSR